MGKEHPGIPIPTAKMHVKLKRFPGVGRAPYRGNIPGVLSLETLADIRVLMKKHLPAEYRFKLTWRQSAGCSDVPPKGQQD